MGLSLTWVQSDPLVDRSCGFVEDIPEVLLQGETAGRLLLCRLPLDGARSLDGSWMAGWIQAGNSPIRQGTRTPQKLGRLQIVQDNILFLFTFK